MSIDIGLRIQGGAETQRTAQDLVQIRTNLQALANTSESVNRLAKTLKLTSSEAESLAKSMNLTADQVTNIAKKLTLLEATTGTSSKKLQQLTKELSPEQFTVFANAIDAASKKAATDVNRISSNIANAKLKLPTGTLLDDITRITFALNNIVTAYGAIANAGKATYNVLIAGNELLNRQLLTAQTNLAASTTISQGGVEITDQIEKIKISRDKLSAAMDRIAIDTLSIVGVTPEKANQVYTTLLANITLIAGQSKKNNDALENATALTGRFAAGLQAANVPLNEADNAIGQILRGEIERENVLARTLNITQTDAQLWKQQGILVDKVNERLEVGVASNKLAAQSISNVSSNLEAIAAKLGRAIGQPLFEPLLEALTTIEKYLLQNSDAIAEFFTGILVNAGSAGNQILENLQPAFESIFNLVLEAGPVLAQLFQLIGQGLATASVNIGPVIAGLVDIIAKATQGIGLLMEAIQLRQINDLADSLERSRIEVNEMSDGALKTVTALKALNEVRDKSPDQTAQQNKLNQLAAIELENIQDRIAYLKQLPAIGSENAGVIKAQIAQLETSKKLLQDNANQISIGARQVEKLGDNYQQLSSKVKGALQSIANNAQGNVSKLNEQFTLLTDLTKEQVDAGQISADEAVKQLQTVISNDSATVDSRKKAIAAINEIRKQQVDLEASLLSAEAIEIQNAGKARVGNELQTAREITAIKVRQLEAGLNATEEAIAREQALVDQNKGSKINLEKLKADARKQQAEIGQVKIDAQLEQEKLALSLIEAETQKAERKIILSQSTRLAAVKSQELAATKIKQIDQARIELESQKQTLEIQGETLAQSLQNKQQELAKVKQLEANATGANKKEFLKKQQEISQEIAQIAANRIDNEIAKVKLARELELKIILNAEARRKQASEALIASLDIEIGKRQILQKTVESQYAVELAALDRVIKATQLQNDLASARASIQQASIGLSQAQGDANINLLRDAANARKELDAGGIIDSKVRLALEAQIRAATGNSSENQLRIAERIFRQEQTNAQLKLDQIYTQQQAARVELENKQKVEQLEQRRNESDAKRQVNIANLAVVEAQITAQKVEQSNIAAIQALQAELAVATAKNDKVAIDAANSKLATQEQQNQLQSSQATQNIDLAKTAVSEAEKNLVAVQQQEVLLLEIANISRQTLEVQQQTELTLANQVEYSRQLAANLTLAKEQAAYFAPQQTQTPQPLPARKDGGSMGANQPFIGAEVGGEAVRYNDGQMGYLATPGIYQLPKPGVIIPASQTAQMISVPSVQIGSIPSISRIPPSADNQLIAEIRELKEVLLNSTGVHQINNFELVDDPSSYRTAIDISLALSKASRK